MKLITLEDHFTTEGANSLLPSRSPSLERHLQGVNHYLGFDSEAALLDLSDARLSAMDEAGIEFQVISLTAPGTQMCEAQDGILLARESNDILHEAIKQHPGRFGGFAALPTADPVAAVQELERAVTRLGFKGALINGLTRGEFLVCRP